MARGKKPYRLTVLPNNIGGLVVCDDLFIEQIAWPWQMLSFRVVFLPINGFLDILCSRLLSLGCIPKIHNPDREYRFRYVQYFSDGCRIKAANPNRPQSHRRCGDQHVFNRGTTIDDSIVSFPWDKFRIPTNDHHDRSIIVCVIRNAFFDQAHCFFFCNNSTFAIAEVGVTAKN